MILAYGRSSAYFRGDPRVGYDAEYLESKFTQIDEASGKRYQAISLTGAGTRKGDSGQRWRGIDPVDVLVAAEPADTGPSGVSVRDLLLTRVIAPLMSSFESRARYGLGQVLTRHVSAGGHPTCR